MGMLSFVVIGELKDGSPVVRHAVVMDRKHIPPLCLAQGITRYIVFDLTTYREQVNRLPTVLPPDLVVFFDASTLATRCIGYEDLTTAFEQFPLPEIRDWLLERSSPCLGYPDFELGEELVGMVKLIEYLAPEGT